MPALDGHLRRHRSRSPSTSPNARPPRRRRRPSRSPPRRRQSPDRRPKAPLPSQSDAYSGHTGSSTKAPPDAPDKEKPNFKPSGLLAADTNKVTVSAGNKSHDVVLKYHEPPEARKPPSSQPWVAYVFKGNAKDPLQTIPLHTRSCWLLGRETAVTDIPTEHPSCSKQHAVLQFRHKTSKDEYGEKTSSVRLYLLDLESANGSYLNGEKVESARYLECRSGDVLKFGDSQREYVLLLPPS